jgi:type III pantothenate kinase
MQDWLSLAIGNSRLHWAWFQGDDLRQTWDTPHFDAATIQWLILSRFNFGRHPELLPKGINLPTWTTPPDLWIASVVPQQTQFWQQYMQAKTLTLKDIPLKNTYPSLGLDRALALWGAIQLDGGPVLVIDGGTALTLTAADGSKALLGGAIFPGVRSLFQTLKQSTAALPLLENPASGLPDRWSCNTLDAIQSGVIYMLTAGLQDYIDDWRTRYPQAPIVLTGGDAVLIQQWLKLRGGEAGSKVVHVAPDLLFAGVKAIVQPHYHPDFRPRGKN